MKTILLATTLFALFIYLENDLPAINKQHYLQSFEQFVSEVERSSASSNWTDWKLREATYRKYSEQWLTRFEQELNDADLERIETLCFRYRKAHAKGIMKRMWQRIIE